MFWRMGDGSIPGVRVRSRVGHQEQHRQRDQRLHAHNARVVPEREFADRPDLLPHVIPTYPPGAKRLLRDNGVWAGALTRDNVTLVTDGIREITPTGIVTLDGTAYDVDVIVYGTGFQASNFLTPMQVTGKRRGRPARAVGGRRTRLPGRHHPRVPELLLPLRTGTPTSSSTAASSTSPSAACATSSAASNSCCARTTRRSTCARTCTTSSRAGRCREPDDGVGLVRREQLVQERSRPGRAELAVHAAGVLAGAPLAPDPDDYVVS